MMRRLMRIVKAESMMFEKFESRPDTSDHTALRFELSTVAVRLALAGRVLLAMVMTLPLLLLLLS